MHDESDVDLFSSFLLLLRLHELMIYDDAPLSSSSGELYFLFPAVTIFAFFTWYSFLPSSSYFFFFFFSPFRLILLLFSFLRYNFLFILFIAVFMLLCHSFHYFRDDLLPLFANFRFFSFLFAFLRRHYEIYRDDERYFFLLLLFKHGWYIPIMIWRDIFSRLFSAAFPSSFFFSFHRAACCDIASHI